MLVVVVEVEVVEVAVVVVVVVGNIGLLDGQLQKETITFDPSSEWISSVVCSTPT